MPGRPGGAESLSWNAQDGVSELDPGMRTLPSERRGSARWVLGATTIVVLALTSGVVVSLLAVWDDSSTTPPVRPEASAVTEVELRQVAVDLGHPVYWPDRTRPTRTS
jgi:hypothetical protein